MVFAVDADTVASAVLGAIQCGVNTTEECYGVELAWLRRADPHTDRSRHDVVVLFHREVAELTVENACHVNRAPEWRVGKHDQELLPTVPHLDVTVPEEFVHLLADR